MFNPFKMLNINDFEWNDEEIEILNFDDSSYGLYALSENMHAVALNYEKFIEVDIDIVIDDEDKIINFNGICIDLPDNISVEFTFHFYDENFERGNEFQTIYNFLTRLIEHMKKLEKLSIRTYDDDPYTTNDFTTIYELDYIKQLTMKPPKLRDLTIKLHSNIISNGFLEGLTHITLNNPVSHILNDFVLPKSITYIGVMLYNEMPINDISKIGHFIGNKSYIDINNLNIYITTDQDYQKNAKTKIKTPITFIRGFNIGRSKKNIKEKIIQKKIIKTLQTETNTPQSMQAAHLRGENVSRFGRPFNNVKQCMTDSYYDENKEKYIKYSKDYLYFLAKGMKLNVTRKHTKDEICDYIVLNIKPLSKESY
jgi:hypothetical protein